MSPTDGTLRAESCGDDLPDHDETRAPLGTCDSCHTPLLQPHGFFGTDLCGPCCTGESATLDLLTWECTKRYTSVMCTAGDELAPGKKPGLCHLCGSPMELSQQARPQ